MSDKYNAAEGAYKIICHELYKLNIYKDNIKENLREDLINRLVLVQAHWITIPANKSRGSGR